MSRPSLPSPPPLEGNDQLITAVITAGWAISLVVLLIAGDLLAPADRWWVWVAVAGSAIGVCGLAYVPWLKRSRSRATAQREHRRQPPAGVPGSRED
ncbi:MAG TPA: DUF2530 domain-containing protein [Streptosporangiaceae bacterium]